MVQVSRVVIRNVGQGKINKGNDSCPMLGAQSGLNLYVA